MRHRPGLCVGGRRREARPPLPTREVSIAPRALSNRTNVQFPPIWGVVDFGYLRRCAIRARRCPERHPRGCLAPIPESPRVRTLAAPHTVRRLRPRWWALGPGPVRLLTDAPPN